MLKSDKPAAPDPAAAPEPAPEIHVDTILVPAGEFIMGTSSGQVDYLVFKEDWAKELADRELFRVEQPQHTLALPAFAIGVHPVTNLQYRHFVWDTNHRTPRRWLGLDFPAGYEDHPVVDVSWADAQTFCRWLREKTGLPYRLPTEAEWERAARHTDGRIYPWGQDFDPWRCNTVEGGKRGTTLVRSYSPIGDSPAGAADIAGNVWEWTTSLLRPYPYQPDDGREDLQADGARVVRGGAWYYSRKLARCASREAVLPSYVSPALGFRLALTVAQPAAPHPSPTAPDRPGP